MKIVVLLGRVLFSLIFLVSGPGHFSNQSIQFATAQGVPLPSLLVPFFCILALMGGISILLGYKAKLGAWIIVVFLVPVTLMMHNFWAVSELQLKQMQLAMFMKNLSLLGGALLIAYFGAGPLSLDHKMGGT
ncbi:DoxX family protein [Pedobacter sp. V48]|uniref:DoxX family protein n=1 Tax=Pedobacter sp. V48 TaxID=509635 RepID=UPI0003E4A47E|nr:DoxX family protein [Pedobacter sp. V48]ETZ23059.1 hypothetical protein N824_20700 [Pedobacter sp. V48]